MTIGMIIGIDPGKSGAITCLQLWNTGEVGDVQFIRLDQTEHDIADQLYDCVFDYKCFAYIEKVHAMPKQGVSSTFKFGRSYGFLIGLLTAMRIPYDMVTPRKWQAAMGCLSGGDKNITKARAQQLFPAEKIIHANADSILIAEYGRRDRVKLKGDG